MIFLYLLLIVVLTGCSNLEIVGNTETVYASGIEKSINKTKIQYKTKYEDTPIVLTSNVLSDMKNLNKPPHVTSSAEIWFW